MFFRVKNNLSHRHFDENGYLYVDKSPILKSGILEYYGSELGEEQIDGIKIIPDKIYKVFLPPEELEKAKDSFALKPLVNGHEWLGKDGKDAKDFQEGTTGEKAEVEGEFLCVPLMFSGGGIIDTIENKGIEELSASYENKLTRSDDDAYDFIATDLKGNHVAVVERGRCGSSVRVLNKEKKMKTKNEVKLLIDGKEIDLGEFFAQEAKEDAHAGTDAITENEDKREIIREIMAISGKPDNEFAGGEDEKVREIAKLAEKLAYKPSETSKADNEEPQDEKDKDANVSEPVKSENTCKAENYDAVYQKIFNAVSQKQKEMEEARVRAYNAAKDVCGDFNFTAMNERDIYVKALNHLGVPTERENVAELSAMLKACKKTVRLDNAFNYGAGENTQEVEPNF